MLKETTTIVREAARTAPPVGVTGWYILGHPVSDYLVVLTCIFTILQIVRTGIAIKKGK